LLWGEQKKIIKEDGLIIEEESTFAIVNDFTFQSFIIITKEKNMEMLVNHTTEPKEVLFRYQHRSSGRKT
jgi:hypothetical protein